jgi:DNA-binding IclR family transcriptional regulator
MALELLETLTKSTAPVGTSELARRLGKTKARVHRHLTALTTLGFVERCSAGYRIGWKTYRLGLTASENFSLRRQAHAHLLALHEATEQTVVLGVLTGADVAIVDTIDSRGHVAITIRAGSVIPASTSALGRAILAFDLDPLPGARPPGACEDAAAPGVSRRRLLEVRKRWYEVAVNERLPGIAALACPVFDDLNSAVGAVGIIGLSNVVSSPPPADLLMHVQSAASGISSDLGSLAWGSRPGTGARVTHG